ncbi:uncharacterized protein [Elaeis guineensis]|uniref:Phytosulfokine n=1 Tax=Elaeis guineensis var. tenera TaxID=51953 RepID=A0A6I9QNJ2_ELAGV|nr:phytosulfokines 2 [Elaeis guineensis]
MRIPLPPDLECASCAHELVYKYLPDDLHTHPPISPCHSLLARQQGIMKRTTGSHVLLPLLFLLVIILSVHTTRASRLLQQPEPGRQDVRVDDLPLPGHAAEMEEKYSWELMGLHECKEEDEECLKRRMISEAHLDYIYTQRHKTYKKRDTSP